MIKRLIGERSLILCIDETDDKKAGTSTDYVVKQYIGNWGKTENEIVSVNADTIVNNITYPLLFKIFKPRTRLQLGDGYKTKPQLATWVASYRNACSRVKAKIKAEKLKEKSLHRYGMNRLRKALCNLTKYCFNLMARRLFVKLNSRSVKAARVLFSDSLEVNIF